MGAKKTENSEPKFPEDLDWSAGKQVETLEKLRAYVVEKWDGSRKWYYDSRGRKKSGGIWYRYLSLIFLAIAAMIPIAVELMSDWGYTFLSPTWATVATIFAALCISLDKFGDFTSGWVRYIRTAHALELAHCEFMFKWQTLKVSWSSNPADPKIGDVGLEELKKFACGVLDIVGKETDQWAQEFQQLLADFDSKVKR